MALAATGLYASQSMHRFYLDQTRQDLMAQARLLSREMLPLVDPANGPVIDRFCKETATIVPIRLTVILPDGLVLGDSEADPAEMENHADRPEIIHALDGQPGASLRFSATLNHRRMYVALPLGKDPIKGVLRVSIAVTAVEKQLQRITMRLVIGGIIIALLTSLVCLIISKRISRPIEIMRQGADRFAQGDLNHRLQPPNTVELASLARAMNQMAEELEHRIQAIIRQGKESETVLSSMMEGVVALDMDERITQLNDAAARLLKASPDALRERSIQEVIRHRRVHEMIHATLSRGETTEDDIAIYQNQEQILNIRCTPLVGARGQRNGALLVFNDVTRLRRLEMIRREFAANVSHEIKTPLTAIKGFVQTLLEGPVDEEAERQRFLNIIHKHVNRLTVIVDDLMQLSRLEQDEEGVPLTMFTAPVKEVIDSAAALCRTKADEKEIKFAIACDPDLTARMDVELMEQAAVNLLDNAVKYSPTGSRVRITVEAVADQITIRFQDNGIGISEKHLPRLFERFYRVDKARSRQMGGTGLGLAIVKHIVQAHGGSVSVTSTLGKGSLFTITIPAA
jgi:two-component system phosphate regulon sensor histidine kinase PhoR